LPSEEDRAAATVNMYRNLVKFGILRYASNQTHKQTDKNTDTRISILCTTATNDEKLAILISAYSWQITYLSKWRDNYYATY